MKKTLIAISVACVGALASMAEVVPYENLKFADPVEWFSATPTGMKNGTITSEAKFADNTLDFDTETEPVTFTVIAGEARTNDLTKVEIDAKAATVPNGKQKSVTGKLAVALYESAKNSATNFIASLGDGEWVTLTCDKYPYEGEDYTLIVRFDNRSDNNVEQKKVKFSILLSGETDERDLMNENATWMTYTVDVARQLNVGFLGQGSLNEFGGLKLVLSAEIIVIPGGGTVEVDEKDLEVFRTECAKTSMTVDQYLGTKAKTVYTETKLVDTDLTVAEAYALGLVKSENGELVFPNNGELDVKAEAATVDKDGNISVGFVDVTPNENSGASFSYQLKRSMNGTDWENSGSAVDDLDDVKIPGTDVANGYHYFKVVTTVTLKDAPPETQVEEQN